ncbi:zinc-ribbon domain-containing protein [Waddlia chondrophila]|uniref:Treble clef zinc finger domain-containing protein n=1 Tax=Waddlia chondrophila (strain ATCC VR-1470 / WSU 86-1044) TaxID=716544 RepID=D6YT36_WADCW|nr:zinc-ribbon domain-containing protein [Waddlia chondrophila]ADI39231.1 hypothetical protein wcw_1894 [Waddlia chondrophila WSU 86-1044]
MSKNKRQKISENLIREWHPVKNGDMDPNKLFAKSGKRPWWLCNMCGHEWQAPIYHRSNGTACPKCKAKSAWTKHFSSILKSRGCLAEQQPHLVLEWHPTKNGDLSPENVTSSSGKKVWWQCSKGKDHEWEATISNRTKGRGCPICSGRKVVLSNSLSTTHPKVADEWHPTKNGFLRPSDVTYASHKKVWWLCSKGHEWIVAVSNRTSRGKSECPHCLKLVIGQRRIASLIKRDGSLAERSPEIASQWHPTKNGTHTPSEFTVGSGYRAWWRCSKGHEWCVPISARKNHGCPKCTYQTSQLEIRIYVELKSIFSKVMWRKRVAGRECDIFIPGLKLAFEVDGYPWHKDREDQDKLKNTHFYTNDITLVRLRDERLGTTGEYDIFYRKKESHLQIIVRLLNYIKKEFYFSASETKNIDEYLSKRKIVNEELFKKILNDVWKVPEEESIAHLFPDLVLDWDYKKNSYLAPKSFSPGSEVSVYWKCKNNPSHVWKGKINSRVKSKGCPFCSGKRVSVDNALNTLHPSLALQWDYEKNRPLKPSEVTAGSSKKVWWKCSCGFSWKASVWRRVQSGNKECLECYNKNNRGKNGIRKAVLNKGSFVDNSPYLAKEWHPTKNGSLLPSMLSCGSSINVWWKCPKGDDHEWQNSIVSRIQHPTCPYCCGKKVSLKNSLAYCFPNLAQEWHPTKNSLSPKEVTKCSGRKVWWKCPKGHEWETAVTARRKGNGCPFCSGKKASSFDNFELSYPEIAKEWHPIKNGASTPSCFRPNSNVKVWWLCSKNAEHMWETSIASRTRGTGCPFCAGKKTSSSYNLAVINPSLSSEWNYQKNISISPREVTPNSGKKVWWQCSMGHEWEATINNRAKGRGCPICKKSQFNKTKKS